ncbi:MAG: hypothetical protein EOM37_13395 [Proteobacteria bacterium]|nr:hypothetical protein [Pseudomonadota bacterium]
MQTEEYAVVQNYHRDDLANLQKEYSQYVMREFLRPFDVQKQKRVISSTLFNLRIAYEQRESFLAACE